MFVGKLEICKDEDIEWYVRYAIWVTFSVFFMLIAAGVGYLNKNDHSSIFIL